MATKQQLQQRWSMEPGLTILRRLYDLFSKMILPHHGLTQDSILSIIQELPFKEEVSGGRDLRGIPLEGGVREFDFKGFDFSYGRLSFNFVMCNLAEASFVSANLKGNISNVLYKTNFKQAHLNGCYFRGADARYACFDSAQLRGASFEGSNLEHASFQRANCLRANFCGAQLGHTSFYMSKLDEAIFRAVQFDRTIDLRGASLINVHNDDQIDVSGKLIASGSDWRLARCDDNTSSENSRLLHDLELIQKILDNLSGDNLSGTDGTQERKFHALICSIQKKIGLNYQPNWIELALSSLSQDEQRKLIAIIQNANEELL